MDTKNLSVLIDALKISPELEIPFRNIIEKVDFAPECINLMSNLCRVPLGAHYIGDEQNSYKFMALPEVLDEIAAY